MKNNRNSAFVLLLRLTQACSFQIKKHQRLFPAMSDTCKHDSLLFPLHSPFNFQNSKFLPDFIQTDTYLTTRSFHHSTYKQCYCTRGVPGEEPLEHTERVKPQKTHDQHAEQLSAHESRCLIIPICFWDDKPDSNLTTFRELEQISGPRPEYKPEHALRETERERVEIERGSERKIERERKRDWPRDRKMKRESQRLTERGRERECFSPDFSFSQKHGYVF